MCTCHPRAPWGEEDWMTWEEGVVGNSFRLATTSFSFYHPRTVGLLFSQCPWSKAHAIKPNLEAARIAESLRCSAVAAHYPWQSTTQPLRAGSHSLPSVKPRSRCVDAVPCTVCNIHKHSNPCVETQEQLAFECNSVASIVSKSVPRRITASRVPRNNTFGNQSTSSRT